MFDCFFIKNFCVDLLYDSIHMLVCLSKTLTGSEVKYTVVLFFKERLCSVKIQNVFLIALIFLKKERFLQY